MHINSLISSTLNTSTNYQAVCCSDGETGVTIGTGGGYILAADDYNVGPDFDLTMMVKLRSSSGILLAVQGRRDYLILQILHDGNLTFTAENGRGPITATTATFLKPDVIQQFSNDNWHNIKGQYYLLVLLIQFS